MSILKVARMGHPALRTKAAPVTPGDVKSPRIQRLIDDMFDTMREYSGIGLAAPQVHESVRIFVAGLRDAEGPIAELAEDDMPFIALVNPQLTLTGEKIDEGWEGCLSIPEVRGLVPRSHEIAVDALDRKGHRIRLVARGLPARVIQHEYDHLDGVLFLDRMPTLATLTFMDEYQKYWTKEE